MKKNKIPNLISVLILTLITVVMWVSFSIYRSLTSQPPAVVPEEVSKPLTPTLDGDTMTLIESRIFLDESQIPENVVAAPTATPTAQPTTAPTATPAQSPTPEGTVEASETPSPTP